MDTGNAEDGIFGLDEEDREGSGRHHEEGRGAGYPGSHVLPDVGNVDGGSLLWSRWDVVPHASKGSGKPGYAKVLDHCHHRLTLCDLLYCFF